MYIRYYTSKVFMRKRIIFMRKRSFLWEKGHFYEKKGHFREKKDNFDGRLKINYKFVSVFVSKCVQFFVIYHLYWLEVYTKFNLINCLSNNFLFGQNMMYYKLQMFLSLSKWLFLTYNLRCSFPTYELPCSFLTYGLRCNFLTYELRYSFLANELPC